MSQPSDPRQIVVRKSELPTDLPQTIRISVGTDAAVAPRAPSSAAPPSRPRRLFLALLAVLVGVVTIVLALALVARWPSASQSPPPPSPDAPPSPAREPVRQAPSAIRESVDPPQEETAHTLKRLFDLHKNRVLVIRLPDGQGTGVIIASDSQGSLAATARHVVQHPQVAHPPGLGSSVEVVHAGGSTQAGVLVGVHRRLDAALLWIPGWTASASFIQPILPSDQIEVTESVWLIGHPLGRTYSFSDGRITRAPDLGIMQFNAAISSGNSGAPLYDLHGNLLGIVSAASGSDQPGVVAQNLNFAVVADVCLQPMGWELSPVGATRLSAFINRSRTAPPYRPAP